MNHRPSKKTLILFISIFTAIMALVIYSIATTPRDLGPKLHYLGKKDYGGCYLFYCESSPGHDYYYATDLSKEELKDYLKGSMLTRQDEDGFSSYPTTYYSMDFKSKVTDDDFYIMYYANTKETIIQYKLRDLGYKHIVRIADFDYEAIKKSL